MILERVRENEPFESAYRRFKRQCEQEQLFSEIKKHERYEKPSERKKWQGQRIRRPKQ